MSKGPTLPLLKCYHPALPKCWLHTRPQSYHKALHLATAEAICTAVPRQSGGFLTKDCLTRAGRWRRAFTSSAKHFYCLSFTIHFFFSTKIDLAEDPNDSWRIVLKQVTVLIIKTNWEDAQAKGLVKNKTLPGRVCSQQTGFCCSEHDRSAARSAPPQEHSPSWSWHQPPELP